VPEHNQLDAIQRASADPSDMMGAILALPEQCERARTIASDADLAGLRERTYANVVIAGLGGSAIGGDLLRAIYEPTLRVPVVVSRDYHLPEFAGSDTLVIVASYSGNTEETLASYARARKHETSILAITTGGELAERAARDGVPVIRIPGGLQPRAAVGYSFVPLVVSACRLKLMPAGLLDDLDDMIAGLNAVRDSCNPEVPQARNRAKQLAAAWFAKIPIIYGSQAERGVVAYRWKCQINENAKAYAAWNVLPELDHNESVGWSGERGQARVESAFSVVFLRDEHEPEQIRRRVDLTKRIVEKHAASVAEVWPFGESSVARAMSLVYTGDFASCYLAYAYGEDPTPVRVIDWLKSELARASRHPLSTGPA
jgi:glucose/mannose-6-phosphate isomerase